MNPPPKSPLATDLVLPAHLRRVHRSGWILFAGWSVTLVVWVVVQPEPYVHGWRLVLELMFVGRAVSIVDGIASGFGDLYLLIQNGLQDVILLLVLYPWIVAGYEQGLKDNFIGRRIEGLRKSAERNRRIVEPFGVLGLLLAGTGLYRGIEKLVGARRRAD